MNGNDLQVKFGAQTGELDQASTRAANDIKKVSSAATQAQGPIAKLREVFKGFTAGFKKGWTEAGAAQDAARAKMQALGSEAAGNFGVFGNAAQMASSKVMLIAAAMAAVWAAMKVINWAAAFGDLAEKLEQMSAKLGMAATEVSRWGALATTAGMSTDAFASSGQRLERAMVAAANGGKQQMAMFNQLGISAKMMEQGLGPTLMRISDAFSKMPDGPKKTAIAMGLMGRAGANMIPILNQGSAEIKKQMETAEEYGAVASEAFMEAGLAVDNSMDNMTLATTGLKNVLFEALAPAIVGCVDAFNDLCQQMVESYRDGGAVYIILQTLVGAFKVCVSAIMVVVSAFQTLWHVAQAVLRGILGTVYSVGSALAKLLSGDFSGMKAAWSNGMAATGRAAGESMTAAFNSTAKLGQNLNTVWHGPKGGKAHPGMGGDGDLEIAGMGGGGKGGGKGRTDRSGEERKRALEQQLRDEIEAINFKQDMAKEDYAEQMRLEEEKLAKLKAFYGEDSREYKRELESKARMERAHQQDMVRLAQDALNAKARIESSQADSANAVAAIELQAARDHFNALDAMGKVNGQQRIEEEQRLADAEADLAVRHEDDIYNIKSRSLLEQLKLENLPLEERRRIQTELEQMEVEHQGRLSEIRAGAAAATARIEDQAAQQTLDKWKGIVGPVESAMGGFLTSMATRSASLGQALISMGDQILTSVIQMGVKAAAQWAAMELAKTGATTAGVATRTAAEATGAATGTAISAGAALKQIAHKAAVAAAGAYAAIASIPVVGPFLAPAAAAAALYGVYKLASGIFSAREGVGEVGADGDMYQLHKKEMVLPAKFANPLRSMLSGAGPQMSNFGAKASAAGEAARSTSSRAGDVNFHYGPKHENKNADLKDLLRQDGRELRKWLKNEVRNGNLKLAGA